MQHAGFARFTTVHAAVDSLMSTGPSICALTCCTEDGELSLCFYGLFACMNQELGTDSYISVR